MKKKNLAFLGLAALASLSLASCGTGGQTSSSNGGNQETTTSSSASTTITPSMEKETSKLDTVGGNTVTSSMANYVSDGKTDSKGLDIYLNYSGKQGITLRDNAKMNSIEGVNYSKGDLLPTWKTFASNLNISSIRDASDYAKSKDNDSYTDVKENQYKSKTDANQMIDLFYNSTTNIEKMGAAGAAVNLKEYVDNGKMPAFKAWLDENPAIASQITKNGKIYYTPYFDGYQDVERMFVMDTNVAKAVLDVTDFTEFDTTKSGKGGAENTLKEAKYTPYMDEYFNYRSKETVVPCLKNGSVQNITIKSTKNIILQQNELLENGCTGKQLAEQFRAYLDTAFEGYIGAGKLFENYSDIFVSESAAYNADELIALMRVVKANPGVITTDPNSEVVGLFPRGVAANRVDNMADFMQIWGIQGMTSKSQMLYFDANGCLNDAAITNQTYDGLDYLAALYSEGLIMKDFWIKPNTSTGTLYLDKYFGKTADNPGYGLIMYDYAASTGAVNSVVGGIGTKEEKRQEGFGEVTGVRPILPPLAYWATETDFDIEQDLTDKTGKTLLRYSEENRSLKSTAWCIPTTSDNIEGAIRLMDYLFTEEGTRIQDFGPDNGLYWTEGEINGLPAGTRVPVMTDAVKEMIGNSGTDFWTFMRAYVGSTHGVGHVRETAIQIQSCNYYAQIGLNNLENAIAAGVVYASRVAKHDGKYSWDDTVPTAGYSSISSDVAASYEDLTAFWASDKQAASANGWVAVVKDGLSKTSTNTIGTNESAKNYTYASAWAQRQARIDNYLFTLASSLGDKFVPDYAK